MSEPIFFAHANGFPSATYAKLFQYLEAEQQIHRLDRHGHDPRFPVNDNWQGLLEELHHHVSRIGTPVWGVGHSLGGVLHYHLALRHPELYLGVVMLDSPVLTFADRWLIRAAKRWGFIDRITPAGRTLGRRAHFADQQQAHEYFALRALFRDFDPDCLAAYVEHGLAPAEKGLRLFFDPATEIDIYRSLPHCSPRSATPLRLPLALLHGAQSRVVLAHHLRAARRLPRGETLRMPGGHMFPLEHPRLTAERLRELFARWRAVAKEGNP